MTIAQHIHRLWMTGGLLLAALLLLIIAAMFFDQERGNRESMRRELLLELVRESNFQAEQLLENLSIQSDPKSIHERCIELDLRGWSTCIYSASGAFQHSSRSLEGMHILPSQAKLESWWHEQLLSGQVQFYVTNLAQMLDGHKDDDVPIALVFRLMPNQHAVVGIGRTFTSAQARYSFLRVTSQYRFWWLSGMLSALIVVTWWVGGYFLRRGLQKTVAKPLSLLSLAIRNISEDRLDQRLKLQETNTPEEIHDLKLVFNQMSRHLERSRAEIIRLNANLERDVQQRTADLAYANSELEAFAYSISHDLKAPLRSVRGFTTILREEASLVLSNEHRGLLERVDGAASRMSDLIEDLLRLSKYVKARMTIDVVRVDAQFKSAFAGLAERDPERSVDVHVDPEIIVHGDIRLLQVVVENLAGNAWKYTARKEQAKITISAVSDGAMRGFIVDDDGAGFDMAYAQKLFTPFQRFHRVDEFPGNGIGLATVARIVRRHGGTVTGIGRPGQGANFTVLLPDRSAEIARLALLNETPPTEGGFGARG